MQVFIASVHHTGTQFTENLFKDNGYGATGKHVTNTNDDYHRSHIADSVKTELTEWLELSRKGLVVLVSPLRHPVELARSWKARKKHIKQMIRQFELMQELVLPYRPYLLPLDHNLREVYFQALKERCGGDLKTAWSVVGGKREGSSHQAQLPVPDFTPEDIIDVQTLTDMPFLRELYPEPWLL